MDKSPSSVSAEAISGPHPGLEACDSLGLEAPISPSQRGQGYASWDVLSVVQEVGSEGLGFVRAGNEDTLFYIMANWMVAQAAKGLRVLYIQRFDPEAKWTLDLDFLEKLAAKRGVFLGDKVGITRDKSADWVGYDLVTADAPLPGDTERLQWIECLKRLSWSLPVFVFERSLENLEFKAPQADIIHSNGWVMADIVGSSRRIPLFKDPHATVRSWITDWVEFAVSSSFI